MAMKGYPVIAEALYRAGIIQEEQIPALKLKRIYYEKRKARRVHKSNVGVKNNSTPTRKVH